MKHRTLHSSLHKARSLFLLVFSFTIFTQVYAQEAYVVYTEDNTTLTFYYDNLKSSRTGMIFRLPSGDNTPYWPESSVTNVVFDSSFASARPTSTYSWFKGMANLTTITDIENLNTSEVTNMANMFFGCSGLTNLDVSYFDTQNVTNMGSMFSSCSGLTNLDVSHFDTQNVKIMGSMFSSCRGLKSLDLSNFNTANVTDMSYIFSRCSSLFAIRVGNGWSTAKVTSSSNMFAECQNLVGCMGTGYNSSNMDIAYAHIDGGSSNPGYFFDQEMPIPYASLSADSKTLTFYCDYELDSRTGSLYPLRKSPNKSDFGWQNNNISLNISKVVFDISFRNARPRSTSYWFYNMNLLTSTDIIGLDNLNTSEVLYMNNMFEQCSSLTTIDLSLFDTSNVQFMNDMFASCSGLTSLDLSNFNTENVAEIYNMFSSCSGLITLNLSNFNTKNVTDMSYMFSGCNKLTSLDLSNFDTKNVSNMFFMFYGCSSLQSILAGNNWSTAKVTSSDNMFYGCTNLVGGMGTVYESSHVDKEYARVDNAPSSPGYFTDPNNIIDPNAPYAVILSDGKTLQFRHDGQRLTMPTLKTYNLNTADYTPGWVSDGSNAEITSVTFLEGFDNARPTSMHRWFEGMSNLTSIWNAERLNTSEVTDMANLFKDCAKLTSDKFDISQFTTSKVTDMSHMFDGCVMLTALDVSHFDTQNVTDMASMFSGCIRLTTLNVSGLNTAKVTDMSKMFYDCGGFGGTLGTLDVTSFDTRQVTDMNGMFYHISARVDVTGFDTQNVTDMHEMFKNVSAEALDLHNFNTAKVTNMSSMFELCYNLGTITVGEGWTVENVTSSENMFRVCSSLTGEKGTRYQDENPTDKTYAHIDGGTGNPGYLTDINGPYAALSQDGKTLTFYNDGQRLTRTEKTYSLSTSLTAQPEWRTDGTNATIEGVVFDESFAEARPVRTQSWFAGMTNLTSLTGMENLNTSEVTGMSSMFYGCTSLTSLDLSHFNTSKVTSMTSMFNGCTGLTTLDLMTFDTGNTTTMSYLFYGCTNLTTIYAGGGWSTAKVDAEYSEHMFEGCTSLVGDKGTAFDANHTDKEYARVDGGTSAPGYFSGVPSYAALSADGKTLTFYCDMLRDSRPGKTYDLNEGNDSPGWNSDGNNANVTTVVFDPSFADARPTSTCSWFKDMGNLSSIIGMGNLNTSEVTDMSWMFSLCWGMDTFDLSHFDTQNVTDMSYMFNYCEGMTNIDMSGFDTRNVMYMEGMFYECSALIDLDLSSFNTEKVKSFKDMFFDCVGLTSLDLSNFDTREAETMNQMFIDCTYLTNLNLSGFNTGHVGDMSSMFSGCSSLTTLDLSSFDTSDLLLTNYMFGGCSNLTTIYVGDGWDEGNIEDSSNMFSGCTSIVGGQGTTFDADHVDALYAHIDGGTENPGYFTGEIKPYVVYDSSTTTLTFYHDGQRASHNATAEKVYGLNEGSNAPGWNSDGNNGNVTKVVFDETFADARPTSTANWFSEMFSLTSFEGLVYLNTSEVTSMKNMFSDCPAVSEVDFSNFDTSNVTDMSAMFSFCGAEELELSSFSTENVTNMTGMFALSSLKTIYVSDKWTTAAVTSSDMMFLGCSSLVGGMGTTYDADHVDAAYAHIDGGSTNPGYFTQKFLLGDVNQDGSITIADVTALVNIILGKDTTGTYSLEAADVNQDTTITIADVTALVNIILGK